MEKINDFVFCAAILEPNRALIVGVLCVVADLADVGIIPAGLVNGRSAM